MKTADCTPAQYAEAENKRYMLLSRYSVQELEDLILTSGKGHALEFLKHFSDFKGGLLTQIFTAVVSRNKSHTTSNGSYNRKNPVINGFEGEGETTFLAAPKQPRNGIQFTPDALKRRTYSGATSSKSPWSAKKKTGTACLVKVYKPSQGIVARSVNIPRQKDNLQAGQNQAIAQNLL